MKRNNAISLPDGEALDRRQLDFPSTHSVVLPAMSGRACHATLLVAGVPPVFCGNSIGTAGVNMLAGRLLVSGATPRSLAVCVTADVDTPTEVVNAIAADVRRAAVGAEMEWHAGELAVLPSGPAGGIALSLFGVGEVADWSALPTGCVAPGDVVIVTGAVGGYGVAVEAARRGMKESIPGEGGRLGDVVHAIMRSTDSVHALMAPERGVDAAVRGIAGVVYDRVAVPVDERVASAARSLGVDPLTMATAGAVVAVVAGSDAERVLAAVRRSENGGVACVIGRL